MSVESVAANPQAAPEALERPPCPAPANFAREVDRYEREAKTLEWQGPRYRMRIRVLGEGPPLVLVPGIASTYRGYALLLNLLSGRFKTIVYDYPGDHKDDSAVLRKIGHADLVDDFFGMLDFLNIGRVFPVGISFGSTIGLSALAREPRRFPKAAFQGAFARRELTGPERWALALGRRLPGPTGNLPLRETIMKWNHGLEFPAVIADRWPLYLAENARTPIASLAHRVDLVGGIDLRPVLPKIATETLLIHGKEDRVVPFRYFEELIASLPSATPLNPPCVGHQTHYTHPEMMAAAIEQFLLPCAPEGCPNEKPSD